MAVLDIIAYPFETKMFYFGPFDEAEITSISDSISEATVSASESVLIQKEFVERATFVDRVSVKARVAPVGDATFRLLRVKNGETVQEARDAERWITEAFDLTALVANEIAFAVVIHEHPAANALDPGDEIHVVFDEPATGMEDCRIVVRCREHFV